MTRIDLSLEDARVRDVADPLRAYRAAFYTSDENLIYLDGNSLGKLPLETSKRVNQQMETAWGSRLIRSWNDSWIDLPSHLAGKLAQLLGASANEVLICDATSLNLYKLAHAAMQFQTPRREIVTDVLNFPSDLYILQGVLDHFPESPALKIAVSDNDIDVSVSRIKELLTPETALLSLSLVTYKSAYLHPLKELTQAAHEVGALVLWDLSHAAGAVEIDLHEAQVDMAVGCTYKYLNGGPGAPAFLYVREDLQQNLESPIKGWFGDANPFAFDPNYKPAPGIQRFSVGTPAILSMTAMEPGLDLVLDAGLPAIRDKSLSLQDYLLQLIHERLDALGFTMGSPLDVHQRGSHISLRHPDAGRICQALINPPAGRPTVIPDFRAPDSIRLGIAPLYVSFEDLWLAVDRLREIMSNREYLTFSERPEGVT